MDIIIASSRHSHKSAKVLATALNCHTFNPYKNKLKLEKKTTIYNMGCSNLPYEYNDNKTINDTIDIFNSILKSNTYVLLDNKELKVPPWTTDINQAKQWLEEDHIIINRETDKGKANEGLSYSYQNIDGYEDIPLNINAKYWTRNIRTVKELRAYCFKNDSPIILEKVLEDGMWSFIKIPFPKIKLLSEIEKAQKCFPSMTGNAFDILECVTGDYYFLENNSAPSLLVHPSILPRLVDDIIHIIQN
jgi:hypothetical protein